MIRILAVGSPYGDDRVGWAVADCLEEEGLLAALPDVELLRCDRPGSRLLEALRGASGAVIVDAMIGGGAAGAVLRVEGDELRAIQGRLYSSHGLGVAAALELARALGELPPRLTLYGIEIAAAPTAATLNAPLSPTLTAAAREVAQRVAAHCRLA